MLKKLKFNSNQRSLVKCIPLKPTKTENSPSAMCRSGSQPSSSSTKITALRSWKYLKPMPKNTLCIIPSVKPSLFLRNSKYLGCSTGATTKAKNTTGLTCWHASSWWFTVCVWSWFSSTASFNWVWPSLMSRTERSSKAALHRHLI